MSAGEDAKTEVEKYLEGLRQRKSRQVIPRAPLTSPPFRSVGIPTGALPPPAPPQQRFTFRVVLQLDQDGEVAPKLLVPSDLPRTPTTKEALALKGAAVYAAQEAGVRITQVPLTIDLVAPLSAELRDDDVEAVFPVDDPRTSRLSRIGG